MIEPSTGADIAMVTIIRALAVATNLYDQSISSFQNGIIRPRLLRAVITILSIKNRAITIIQPRPEFGAERSRLIFFFNLVIFVSWQGPTYVTSLHKQTGYRAFYRC